MENNEKLGLFIKGLIFLLSVLLFFELFNNFIKIFLLFLGILCIVYPKKISKKKPNIITTVGIFLVVISLFSTISSWVLLAVLLILFLNENQDLLKTIKNSASFSPKLARNSEFITVHLDKEREEKVLKRRTPWFGNEGNDTDIYEWEDVNFSKVFGNTVIDLGNTIVPQDQNIVLVRNGVGDIKLLVPEEIAVSLNLSVFAGEIKIDEEVLSINNETVKWKSENYKKKSRKIKIVATTLLGQIEVIFI